MFPLLLLLFISFAKSNFAFQDILTMIILDFQEVIVEILTTKEIYYAFKHDKNVDEEYIFLLLIRSLPFNEFVKRAAEETHKEFFISEVNIYNGSRKI